MFQTQKNMYSHRTVAVVFTTTRLISWRVALSRGGSGRSRRTKHFPSVSLGVRMAERPVWCPRPRVPGLPRGLGPGSAAQALGLRAGCAALWHTADAPTRGSAAPGDGSRGTRQTRTPDMAPHLAWALRTRHSHLPRGWPPLGGPRTGLRCPLLPVISFLIGDLAQPAFLIVCFKWKGLMFVPTRWDLSFCISSATCG